MSLFGQFAVETDLLIAKQDVTVVSGTLKVVNSSPQVWENLRICPKSNRSGLLGENGNAVQENTITAWRVGEEYFPGVDDQWVIAGTTFNIMRITKIYDDDEADGYCVYETMCTRKPSD